MDATGEPLGVHAAHGLAGSAVHHHRVGEVRGHQQVLGQLLKVRRLCLGRKLLSPGPRSRPLHEHRHTHRQQRPQEHTKGQGGALSGFATAIPFCTLS